MGASNHVSSHRIRRLAPAALVGLLFLPTLGCSGGEDPPDEGALSSQALDDLIAASAGSVGVSWNERARTPRTVYGALGASLAEVSEDGALRFVDEHAAIFRLRDHAGELLPTASPESPMGRHFGFQQLYRGVPVHGAKLEVHVDARGNVVALSNGYVPGLALDTTEPAISSTNAVEIARAAIPAVNEAEPPTSELVVLASGEAPALAYRVVLGGLGPTNELFIDARTGEPIGEPVDINRYATGTAQVFNMNAIVATHDNGLRDNSDAASAVPPSAYTMVALQGLVGNGYLDGEFASSADTSKRASSATGAFIYDRASVGFNEAMGYYYIDYAQRYIQSLGFFNVDNRQQIFSVNRYKQDNSYYSPSSAKITYGTGGVDDAEDAEVILHEYGHSIQDNQVPGFGSSAQGGAMGEGFGDYWAASVGAQLSGGFQDTCVAEWDATSYSSSNPPCLRHVDGNKHYPESYVGEVHADGEMWSAALWQIRGALGAARADKLILQAHFLVPASGNFSDGSNALVIAAQNLGYTATEVSTVRNILLARGFSVTV